MTAESSQTAKPKTSTLSGLVVFARHLQDARFVNEHSVSKSKSLTLTNFIRCHIPDTPHRAEFGTTFARAQDGSHWIQSACVAIQGGSLNLLWSSHNVAGTTSGTGWWRAVSELEDPVNDDALALIPTYKGSWLLCSQGRMAMARLALCVLLLDAQRGMVLSGMH